MKKPRRGCVSQQRWASPTALAGLFRDENRNGQLPGFGGIPFRYITKSLTIVNVNRSAAFLLSTKKAGLPAFLVNK